MKVIKTKKFKESILTSIINQKEEFQDISGPFVSKLHHRYQTQDKLYFITDLVVGSKLSDYLLRKFQLKEKAVRFYAAEMVLALKAIHEKGVIYKGLKPSNVLIDHQGHIKVKEPGVSLLTEDNLSRNTTSGESSYIAPEILLGEGASRMNDWWSFGAIMYEMVSGYPPFLKSHNKEGNRFTNIINTQINCSKRISNALKDFLLKILCINPNERLGFNGISEIMNHEFFQNLNWDLIAQRQLEPPYIPKNKSISGINVSFLEEDLFQSFEDDQEGVFRNRAETVKNLYVKKFAESDHAASDSTRE